MKRISTLLVQGYSGDAWAATAPALAAMAARNPDRAFVRRDLSAILPAAAPASTLSSAVQTEWALHLALEAGGGGGPRLAFGAAGRVAIAHLLPLATGRGRPSALELLALAETVATRDAAEARLHMATRVEQWSGMLAYLRSRGLASTIPPLHARTLGLLP